MQVLKLRRDGNFPFLLWKDTAPQHFESLVGEYPQVSQVTCAEGLLLILQRNLSSG